MPMLADLSRAIASYGRGEISLDAFEDWFRTASRGMFGESEQVIEACVAIEAAFSRYYYEGITEPGLREELAAAIAPFAQRAPSVWKLVHHDARDFVASGNSAKVVLLEAPLRDGEDIPVVVVETRTSGVDIDRRPRERTTSVIPFVQFCAQSV